MASIVSGMDCCTVNGCLEPCEPTQTKLRSEDKWVVCHSSCMTQNSIYNNKDRNTAFDCCWGLPPFHTAFLDT